MLFGRVAAFLALHRRSLAVTSASVFVDMVSSHLLEPPHRSSSTDKACSVSTLTSVFDVVEPGTSTYHHKNGMGGIMKFHDPKEEEDLIMGSIATVLEPSRDGLIPQQQGQEKKKRRQQPARTWEEKFALLRQFKRTFGHCRVPPKFVVHGVKLGGWVDTQRKEYKKRRMGVFSTILNDKREVRLERVGFDWDPLHITTTRGNGLKGWDTALFEPLCESLWPGEMKKVRFAFPLNL